MSNSGLTLSYSFSQAPTHHGEATLPTVGKGLALAASADQVGAGKLKTGGQYATSSFSSDGDGQ